MTATGMSAAAIESAYLDAELGAYLRDLAENAAAVAGTAPDLDGLRRGARAARLQAARGGPPMSAVDLTVGPLAARLYMPLASQGLIVYLHGGGWVLLDLDTHDHILRTLAQLTGCAVVGLDQPRAPEVRFPALPMACAQALQDVRRHPTLAPLADQGLILSGDSSGANLALAVAVSSPAACAALLLFYGVFDSRLDRPSFRRFGKPPFLLSPDRMTMFWDHYCDPDLRLHPDAAPVLHDRQALAALPPIHLTIAGSDVLLDENIEMASHLAAAGVSITTNLVERAPHGFIEAIGQSRLADTAMAVAAAWVRGQIA